MKQHQYLLWILIGFSVLMSCKDDNESDFVLSPGNPTIDVIKIGSANVLFGDSLMFTASVSDNVPLSVLNVQLYFGDDKVSETTIRTKNNGEYSGKVYVPYYRDIQNGTATLEFTLKDTHVSVAKKTNSIAVSRPVFPYLILVTSTASYPMTPTGNPYEYAATESFPSADLPAYIKTPVMGTYGNEITFGWDAGDITQGSVGEIPFSSAQSGNYTVTFNTKTYQASPFFELTVNGQKMAMIDKENFRIDMELTQGQNLKIEGISNIATWWIDTDFFTKVADNEFKFAPIAGKYRIIANTVMQYFRVEALSGNEPAILQADGTGAIWIIGESIGKPSVATNEVGWNTDKALCMAAIGNKKYQITVVGGETVGTASINFKFFHQKGWGSEFTDNLTTTSDLVFVGSGGSSGRDSGNLGLLPGITLEQGVAYVFTVDLSAGISNAILTVKKKV